MKNMYISENKIIKALCGLAVLAVSACTNAVDDYYTGGETATGEGTVLEYLESNPDYSDFVKLVGETGLTGILSGSDLVTVWAPVNSRMPAEVASMSPSEKLRLARNHISITTVFSRNLDRLSTVGTMAGKYLSVEHTSGVYSIDGVALSELDRVFENGVVHRASEWLTPRKNLYQWLEEVGDEYSRFRDTLFAHNLRVFDKENSPIIGVDENGRIIYDSVWIVKNDLLNDLDLNDESVRYTLLAPDNAAFEAMFREKTEYLESVEREVTQDDTLKWVNWMMQASLHSGLVDFQPNSSLKSVLGKDVRTNYQTVLDPVEMSNGRIYPMSKCYVPRSVYFESLEFNPYYLRKEIVDGGKGFSQVNPGPYDSYKSTINNFNSRLVPDKLAAFFQYTTNFQDNYYQFKSCTYDEEQLTNIPLSIMPGKYRVRCHLVSYKYGNANQTDILDVYQVHGENDMTLIGRAEGIVANAFDNGKDTGNDVIGLLTNEYEVTGKYQPLELRIVIPGKFTAGEKRRICVGRIVLYPTDNY